MAGVLAPDVSPLREEQLQLRSKLLKRRKMIVSRRERPVARAANDIWSLDFVADQLADGTRFRALTVVDVFTREALVIDVGQRCGRARGSCLEQSRCKSRRAEVSIRRQL